MPGIIKFTLRASGQVRLSGHLAYVKRCLHGTRRAGTPTACSTSLELPDNERPLYQRLADAIGERIARGELVEGEKLPPHREIARSLGINVTTVTRAFSALQQRGLVEARPGRGTLIAARETDEGFVQIRAQRRGGSDRFVREPARDFGLSSKRWPTLLPRLAKDRRYRRVAGLSSARRSAMGARRGRRVAATASRATATRAASF